MKGLIIGLGAAGNKSTIALVESEVIEKDDLMLVNSVLMDVPDAYKDACYLLKNEESEEGGFGKERTKSKTAMLEMLRAGELPVKQKVEKSNYKFVAVVTSTEGGTGSGAAVTLASYLHKVVKLPTHIIGFTGFGTDGRGLQNTIEFLQDIDTGVIPHIIRNDKFLPDCGNSKIRAEKTANDELATIIRIIEGQFIKESTQNIDPRDIYKTVNTPGYQVTEYYELTEKIKNRKDFDNVLTDMLDNSHAMSTNPSQLRLAVILNMNEKSQEFCDDYHVLKERLGSCYEEYTHRQNEGKEFIAFISSGLKMPIDEAKEIYEQYKIESSKVDKDSDNFFEEIKKLKGDSKDSVFDMTNTEINSGDEDDFFASYEKKEEKKLEEDHISEY